MKTAGLSSPIRLICAILISLIPSYLLSQVGSGVITGIVRDQTGQPIPKAAVKLVNTDSGVSTELLTNESGAYRANSILPGKYEIEASATGFASEKQPNIQLSTAQVLAVDLKLTVGSASQTITVEGASDLAETQSASLAQVVGHQYIDKLPLPNRSANSLVALSPGVVLLDPGQGAENYPIFSVAGGRERSQNFELDGGSIGNAVGLTRASQVASLPLDALEEFRIISNNYAAEYGHSTGGVVLLTTRSGTNQFHGSIFEYLRNNALDARNFFASATPPLRLNQFGGALGGPIRKDKTHFFVSWEQTRQASSDTLLSTVPTLAERAGDFSGFAQLYNPFTTVGGAKQPFVGNRIPVTLIDPVAKAASAYWPLPNRNGGANGANNYGANSPQVLNRNIIVGKLDQTFREADRLSARYYINDASTENSGSYGIPVADPSATSTDVRIQSFLGTYTHTFSPTLLNNFQVSYMQRKFVQTRPGSGDNYAAKLGLTGVSAAAFPTFNVAGYALLGSQGIANSSIARIQSPIRDTQIQDAISKTAGQHSFKAGLEYRFGYNNESNDLSSSGNFTFNRLITDRPGAGATGDAYASFLLGAANAATLNATDVIPSHAAYWSAYVQDDWRVTSRLTLNLGLRWEVETPRTVDGDKLNGFDPSAINPVSGTPGVVTFANRNGVPRTSFDANYRNFGPRAGFAYTAPFVRGLIVRGGGGIFYGPNISNSVTTGATLGYSDNVSLVTPLQADTSYALQLSSGFPAHPRPLPNTAGIGAVPGGQTPNTAVTFFDRNRPSPISYQFNLDLQKEIGNNVVLETGYLGNVSHHLSANDLTLDQVPDQLLGPGNAQSGRPFPQFSNVTSLNPNIGNSTYHAIFVKAERRFSNGFSFLGHYTFSKFIDDVASGDEFGDPGSYMDQYNRRLDKGLSGSDIPQRLVVTVLYQTPGFRNRRLLSLAAGSWQLGVNTSVQSGAVFTVFDSANTTNGFPAGTLRPNLAGTPGLGDQSSLAHFFNTDAFQHPANYQFGNSPRSVLRGPHTSTVDLSAAKTLPITERFRTELRGSLFNALNIANFNVPGHTLGNADFGIISSAKPARTVQLALRILF